MDAAVLSKLDEVGPLLPVAPRAPTRDTTPPAVAGRQGLRRVKRLSSGGPSSGGVDGDEEEEDESGDDQTGAMSRGGGMGGGSISSIPARTPPALLIPRRTDSGPGGDSPVYPPPEKVPKLDDDIVGEGAGGAGGSSSAHSSYLAGAHPALETYHAPEALSLYGVGALGATIEHAPVVGGSVAGLGMGGAAAGGGHVAAEAPLFFGGAGMGYVDAASAATSASTAASAASAAHGFGEKVPVGLSATPSAPSVPPGIADAVSEALRAPSSEAPCAGMASIAPATGAGMAGLASALGTESAATAVAAAAPLALPGLGGLGSASVPSAIGSSGGGGGGSVSAGSGLETLGSSPDVIAGSLLGTGADAVASALEGIGDDLIGGGDPSMPSSESFGGSLLREAGAGDLSALRVSAIGGDVMGGVHIPVPPARAAPVAPDSAVLAAMPIGTSADLVAGGSAGSGAAAATFSYPGAGSGAAVIATTTAVPTAGAGSTVDAYSGTSAGAGGGVVQAWWLPLPVPWHHLMSCRRQRRGARPGACPRRQAPRRRGARGVRKCSKRAGV